MVEPTRIETPWTRPEGPAGRDELARRLWDLWRQGQRPRVEDFLAHASVTDPGQVLEVLLVDQAERFRSGQGISAEAYLDAFPTVRDDPEQVVDLVFAEYLLREELGEQPVPEDYIRRFPQYAAALELQVELHQAIGSERAVRPTWTERFSPPLAPGETQHQAGSETLPNVPGYEILDLLGWGGMGVVYRACHRQLNRPVAVKVIKPGMDSRQVIARFEAERQALALMDHPNIAQVLDAGTTDSGHPFFIMELVGGIPITEYCDRNRLSTRERLELFIPVCQAIQHAHQKGIIHRDVKPSNVLVTLAGGAAVPKVIDFGVAKAIDRRLTERTMFTQFGVIVGTFEYMSPEQAEMGVLDVDTRSDIYSLGAVLYELLAGSTPLEQAKLRGAAFTEILRRIREEEPPKPSTRLGESKDQVATIAARRQTDPARLKKLVRGELDWIAMKALEKDRSRRYESASALARDIERYLAGDPVEAGPPRAAYRFRKFAGKHRAAFATVGLFAGMLLTMSAVSTWQAIRATTAEGRATDQAARALRAEAQARAEAGKAQRSTAESEAVRKFLENDLLAAARPEGQDGGLGKDVTIHQAVDAVRPRIAEAFKDQPVIEAAVRSTLGKTYDYLGEYDLAIRELERAVELRQSALGPDLPDTLKSRSLLAEAYLDAGRTAEAITLHEATVKLHESNLGPDHPETLDSRNTLGAAYLAARRTAEAITLLEATLKLHESKLGPDHHATLESRSNLAAAYLADGRTALAISLDETTLKLRESKLGLDHPHTLTTRSNLAVAHYREGRLDRSIPLFAVTLKLRESKLGPDHPDTLATQANLGINYREAGRMDEGIRLMEQVLDRVRARYRATPPSLAFVQRQLAIAYAAAGQPAKAEKLLRDGLERARKQFGSADPRTAAAMAALGTNLILQRNWVAAEPVLRECLSIFETAQSDDWRTFDTRSQLGGSLMGQGKFAEAEPLVLAGFEGLKAREAKIPAPVKSRLSEAAARIVKLYEAWGKNDKAAEWRATVSPAAQPAQSSS
jgi:serine/threonine protein kinase